MRRRVGRVALWAVLVLVLGLSSWRVLSACGLALPGGASLFDFCPATAGRIEDPGQTALARETARERLLEDQLARVRHDLAAAPDCPRPTAPGVGDACLEPPAELVVALDVSRSMTWSVDIDTDLEQRANELWLLGDRASRVEADRIYRSFRNVPGVERIDVAKTALEELINTTPREIDIGMVAFSRCNNPEVFGHFPYARRDALLEVVRTVRTRSDTALAAGLEAAARLLGPDRPDGQSPEQSPSYIVLISDGLDSCDGDPCGTARRLKQEYPNLRVNVIALSPVVEALSCIAEATGGQLFVPDETDTLAQSLQIAAGQAVCQ